jgi:hypothetical protein
VIAFDSATVSFVIGAGRRELLEDADEDRHEERDRAMSDAAANEMTTPGRSSRT